jgi:hypothetical protein
MVMEENTPPDVAQKRDMDDVELPAEQVVVAYHERTKHHYHRYAASLGYLDWAKQPDPFRRYDGAPLVRLPLPEEGRALPFWQLYVADNLEPAPLSADSISLFLRYALPHSLEAVRRSKMAAACQSVEREPLPQAYSRSVELRCCSGIDGSQKPAIITGKREWFKKYQPSRSK